MEADARAWRRTSICSHGFEGSLPSSLAKSISIVKKLKKRALSLPGKLPAPSILVEFCVEIWERESAPAELMPDISAIYRRGLAQSRAEIID